jgi:hypothetical protein
MMASSTKSIYQKIKLSFSSVVGFVGVRKC